MCFGLYSVLKLLPEFPQAVIYSSVCSDKLKPYKNLSLFFFSRAPSPAEDEELGPPPSVDEAADALMTRLGFLLGDKVTAGDPPYHAQDDGQVTKSSLNISLQRRLSVLQSKQISCSYKTTPHTNHNTYILSEVDGNNVHHT